MLSVPRSKRWIVTSILALFFGFAPPLHAGLVQNLYTVELPVADQTTTQRLQVFNQAMREVIVKVSGSSDVLQQESLQRPLNNSARYVQQYRYFNRRDADADSLDSGQLFLRVAFNQDALEKLLRENNVPIWGRERPSTLMLIRFELNKKAALVSGDTTPDILVELEDAAKRMGLPVLFPLLDLEDRVILGVEDVIELNEVNIQALSDRYAPDAVLVGQISGRVGKGWQGEWQVRLVDRIINWSYRGQTRQDTINNLTGRLAATLATEYALQTEIGADEDILLGVEDVDLLTDHTRLLAYLQSLDAVEAARLVLIHEDRATYRVSLRNSVEDLQRLISLGSILEQLDLPSVDTTSDDSTVLLNYQLLR